MNTTCDGFDYLQDDMLQGLLGLGYRNMEAWNWLPWMHGSILLLGLILALLASGKRRWPGWMGAGLLSWGLFYPSAQLALFLKIGNLWHCLACNAGPFATLWLFSVVASGLALAGLGVLLLRAAWKNHSLAAPWPPAALALLLFWVCSMLWLVGAYRTFGWGTLLGLPLLAIAVGLGAAKKWRWAYWSLGSVILFGLTASVAVLFWRWILDASSAESLRLLFYALAFAVIFVCIQGRTCRRFYQISLVVLVLVQVLVVAHAYFRADDFQKWEKKIEPWDDVMILYGQKQMTDWKPAIVLPRHEEHSGIPEPAPVLRVDSKQWIFNGTNREGIFANLKKQFDQLHPNQPFPGNFLLVVRDQSSWKDVLSTLERAIQVDYVRAQVVMRASSMKIPAFVPPGKIDATLKSLVTSLDRERWVAEMSIVDKLLWMCPACLQDLHGVGGFGGNSFSYGVAMYLRRDNYCCTHLFDLDSWAEFRFARVEQQHVTSHVKLSATPHRSHFFALPASMPWSEARPLLLDAAIEHGRLFLRASE